MKIASLFFFTLSWISFADYAWIPKEQTLILKTGWELFKSDNNFDRNGKRTPLLSNGLDSSLVQNSFSLDAEYGLGSQWAAEFHTGILMAGIRSNSTSQELFSSSGLQDTSFGFKWQVASNKPLVTIETAIFFPPYSVTNLGSNELALGDGVSSVLFRPHVGTQINRFSFALSPGLLFRFGKYSHQAILDAAISAVVRRFYFRLFHEGRFSLVQSNGSLTPFNQESGSGGSFSRLVASPDFSSLGLKAGYFLSRKIRVEGTGSQTVWGQEAADGFRVGFAFISNFDFETPDTREPIKEVPFHSE